jgi:hypothetical protein
MDFAFSKSGQIQLAAFRILRTLKYAIKFGRN